LEVVQRAVERVVERIVECVHGGRRRDKQSDDAAQPPSEGASLVGMLNCTCISKQDCPRVFYNELNMHRYFIDT
jgi:hypothetical protein